jgi:protein arginine kinase activator
VQCDSCTQAATVHLTDIINGQKKEIHLCEACAEKRQLLQNQELNLSLILQTVLGQHVDPVTDELARLTCPACGIKYMEFRAEGRLGCPHDYSVFQIGLTPLLQRIHRADRHRGKRPRRGSGGAALQVEIVQLRQQLRQAIETEAYEEAGRLRDLLRQKEAAYGSG